MSTVTPTLRVRSLKHWQTQLLTVRNEQIYRPDVIALLCDHASRGRNIWDYICYMHTNDITTCKVFTPTAI